MEVTLEDVAGGTSQIVRRMLLIDLVGVDPIYHDHLIRGSGQLPKLGFSGRSLLQ
jgi:hypothetical protein